MLLFPWAQTPPFEIIDLLSGMLTLKPPAAPQTLVL